jgi:hypothetical protein
MIDLQAFFKNIKQDNNFINLLIFIVLISIPLHYTINSISVGCFFIISLINNKTKIKINFDLLLPIFLYLLMFLSCLWTTDKTISFNSLSKEIPLLIIPLSFIFLKNTENINTQKVIQYYSYFVVVLSLFFILRSTYNYFLLKNIEVFFFHNLVTKDLNAVHFSVFVSIAFFYFWTKEVKTTKDIITAIFLAFFLFLLSSKNIIFITILLSIIHFFYFSKSANKMRLRNVIILGIILMSIFSFSLIKERLIFEFKIKKESNIGHTVIKQEDVGSNIISMKEAWSNQKFNQTDFFSGSSFRVYQARLFFEFLKEENIFWTGFGLNASYKKIEEKGIQNNVFQGNEFIEGYQKKNFHNQYIQVFAELGILGFILLVLILIVNLKNAIKHKDFIHIAFAVLMISLFLTESFLWRQRGVVFFTAFYCLFNNIKKR